MFSCIIQGKYVSLWRILQWNQVKVLNSPAAVISVIAAFHKPLATTLCADAGKGNAEEKVRRHAISIRGCSPLVG